MPANSTTNQSPQPIIDLILADINAVIPNLSSLVASYRLLVGAAEEIRRTPEVCPEVFERSVRRFDSAGTLIDIFLELLCCKIAFSSEFLKVSCAPVDLFRLLDNRTIGTDTPLHTAEQVVELEVLRRILEKCHCQDSCLPNHTVVCPKPPSPPSPVPPAPTPSSSSIPQQSTDIPEVAAVILLSKLQLRWNSLCAESPTNTNQESNEPLPTVQSPVESTKEPPASRIRRRHLRDAYDSITTSKNS